MRHSVDQRLHYITGPTVYQGMRPAAAAGGYVIQDTFTDTNTTVITSHTPDIDTPGGGWLGSSNWAISSNRLYGNATTYSTVPYINTGINDYVVTVKFFITNSYDSSVVTRGIGVRNSGSGIWNNDANSGYVCGVKFNGNKIVIARTATGASLAETAFTVSHGVEYTLTVTCNGSSITAAVGATSVEYTGADTTGGYVGLFSRYAADYLDDLTVEAI